MSDKYITHSVPRLTELRQKIHVLTAEVRNCKNQRSMDSVITEDCIATAMLQRIELDSNKKYIMLAYEGLIRADSTISNEERLRQLEAAFKEKECHCDTMQIAAIVTSRHEINRKHIINSRAIPNNLVH